MQSSYHVLNIESLLVLWICYKVQKCIPGWLSMMFSFHLELLTGFVAKKSIDWLHILFEALLPHFSIFRHTYFCIRAKDQSFLRKSFFSSVQQCLELFTFSFFCPRKKIVILTLTIKINCFSFLLQRNYGANICRFSYKMYIGGVGCRGKGVKFWHKFILNISIYLLNL